MITANGGVLASLLYYCQGVFGVMAGFEMTFIEYSLLPYQFFGSVFIVELA